MRRLSILTGLVILSACAGKDASSDQHQPFQEPAGPMKSVEPPASYSLADAGCQSDGASVALTSTSIYAWNGPTTKLQPVLFHDANSGKSLADQAINGTTFADQYGRSCDYKLKPNFCDDGSGGDKSWSEIGTGGPLRICRDQIQYPRLSYEGVALTSLYFIQQARDKYLQVTAQDGVKAPAAIGLSVLPQFITDYANFPVDPKNPTRTETLRTYITDNLAYFPDAQMIAVFPVKASQPDTGGYFWESGFVLGHEYGHHIDFTRHGKVLTTVGLRWDPVTHSYSDDQALATFGNSMSDRAQIAGSEAEGFADMLGYYATGGTGDSLSGIPGLGFDRNIHNDAFSNHTKKILNVDDLQTLLAGPKANPTYPNFADIHVVGAIIAYTADQVFTKLTLAEPDLQPGSAEETGRRYHLTLQFMDALVQGTAALEVDASGEAVIAPLTQALTTTTEDYLRAHPPSGGISAASIKSDVCNIITTQLPALGSAPFSINGSC